MITRTGDTVAAENLRSEMQPRFRFDSWESFVSEVAGRQKGENDSCRPEWYGNIMTPEQADVIMRDGWLDGWERSQQFTGGLVGRISHMIKLRVPRLDVAGISFDVGMLLSGEPEHWLTFEDSDVETRGQEGTRIFRMVYHIGRLASVAPSTIEARGAVAVALVDLIERVPGYRVQVDALYNARFDSWGAGGSPNKLTYTVAVKRAEESLNGPLLAFTLAHPAMSRWACFRFLEKMGCHGYGSSEDLSAAEREALDCDLYIPRMDAEDPDTRAWTSPELAEKWILKTLAKLGIKLENDGKER